MNIDAVALTAMAKHPADRYQSAAEFAEDLKRVSRNAVSQAARSHLTRRMPHDVGLVLQPVPLELPALRR